MMSLWKNIPIATDNRKKIRNLTCELLINISTILECLTYSLKTATSIKVCSVICFYTNFFMSKLMSTLYIFFGLQKLNNYSCFYSYNNYCIYDLHKCLQLGNYND